MKTARRHGPNERGFALVPALFLLVIVGALGLIAVRVGTGQEQAVVMGLMQARALSAANSGIEWAAYEAFSAGSCAASTTLSLSEASLAGFAVVVTCIDTTFSTNGGVTTNNSYVMSSVATSGIYGQPSYVRRTVSATFTDATP